MRARHLYLMVSIAVLSLMVGQDALTSTKPGTQKDESAFLKVLVGAYYVSCFDVESLRDYYLKDAEIINNGRQVTLDDTIKELKESISTLSDLKCSYKPKIRSSRIEKKIAYIVVRETIELSAQEIGEQRIQQLCTYIFSKKRSKWKIAHDHCSSIPGMAV